MNDYIGEIINEYLNKRYPKETEAKIRTWLADEEHAEEKNEALSAYWEMLHVDPDIFVYESLEQVKDRLLQMPRVEPQEIPAQEAVPECVPEPVPEIPSGITATLPDYPSDIITDAIPAELLPPAPQNIIPEETPAPYIPPVIRLSSSDVIEVPVYEAPVTQSKPDKTEKEVEKEVESTAGTPRVIHLREPEPIATAQQEEPPVISPVKKKPSYYEEEDLLAEEKNKPTFYWGKIAAVIIPFLFIIAGGWYYMAREKATEHMVSISVPYGETTRVDLQDGSVVWLNAGSTLSYPEEFVGAERRVQLHGEGFFSVTADNKRPFKVETASLTVEVLGTEFNVMAYSGDRKATTTLVNGKVRVETANKEFYDLLPSQQLDYEISSAETMIRSVDKDMVTEWKEGNIIFSDASLKEIIKTLERRLNVRFQVDESLLQQEETYTVKFVNNETIEDILNILQEMIDFNWRDENEVIYIGRK